MIKYEDECVGCPPEMGCLGNSCRYKNVKHLYCDRCGEDCEELYVFDGEVLCEECLKANFETIIQEEYYNGYV